MQQLAFCHPSCQPLAEHAQLGLAHLPAPGRELGAPCPPQPIALLGGDCHRFDALLV